MLARFDERAPAYDRDNEFFTEDFEELRERGYLLASRARGRSAAPGLNLAEINRLQRRIAYVAPATAVAVNMHHYFVGLCADLHRAGDPSGDWVLRQAADGARVRRRPRRGGQRHPGAAVVVEGRACRRRLGVHRAQDLRQPVAGVDVPRHPRHGHQRPGQPQGRPRLPAPRRAELPHRRDVGHDGHAGDDVARHHPRPRVRPRRGDHPGLPGRASPAPTCSTSPCSPGRCSASPASTPRSPSGRSTTPSPRSTSASRWP